MPQTIDGLIKEAKEIADASERLNRKLREWRTDDAAFGDPINIAFDLSGSRNWDRVVWWLEQAKKQEPGKGGTDGR